MYKNLVINSLQNKYNDLEKRLAKLEGSYDETTDISKSTKVDVKRFSKVDPKSLPKELNNNHKKLIKEIVLKKIKESDYKSKDKLIKVINDKWSELITDINIKYKQKRAELISFNDLEK